MATPKKPPPATTETPFERFERLARRLANVPKEKVREKPE
jgi:hypothetical protein